MLIIRWNNVENESGFQNVLFRVDDDYVAQLVVSVKYWALPDSPWILIHALYNSFSKVVVNGIFTSV